MPRRANASGAVEATSTLSSSRTVAGVDSRVTRSMTLARALVAGREPAVSTSTRAPTTRTRAMPGTSSSNASPEMHRPGMQLRSRAPTVSPADGSDVAAVRGRRQSRSGSSSRVSETSTLCDQTSTSEALRNSGRSSAINTAGVGRMTRSGATGSFHGNNVDAGHTPVLALARKRTRSLSRNARMSIGGNLRLRSRLPAVGPDTFRTERKALLKSPRSPKAKKSEQRKQDNKKAAETTSCTCEIGGRADCVKCDMLAHVEPSKAFLPCPLARHHHCQWKGPIIDSKDHIIKDCKHHSVKIETGPSVIVSLSDWKNTPPMQWVTLQTCLGKSFLLILKKEVLHQNPLFLGTVKMFGCKDDADRFEFRMTLQTNGRTGRTFSYSSVVRALYDEENNAGRGDDFNFPSSYAELFSCDGNLEVKVSISVMKM